MNHYKNSLTVGQYLLVFYIVSLFATHLILPPLFYHHFQLSEFIFLLLVGYHWPLFTQWSSYAIFIKRAWPVALYLGVLLLSMLIHPSQAAAYEVGGGLYLFLLAFLFFHKGAFLFSSGDLWLKAMAGLAFLIILPLTIDLICMGVSVGNCLDLWRTQDQAYPYIGTYARPQGWHFSPTMLLAVLALPFFSFYLKLFTPKGLTTWQILIFALLGVFVLLTLGKDLIFIMALLLLPVLVNTGRKSMQTIYAIGFLPLIALQQFLTLFIPVSSGNRDADNSLVGWVGCMDSPAFSLFDTGFYESVYFLMRNAQFQLLDTIGFWGVGLGQFPAKIAAFDPTNPRYNGCYEGLKAESHQTFLGAFLEMGVPGLVAMCLLFLIPLMQLWKRRTKGYKHLLLFSLLLLYTLMALSIDVEDFRVLWLTLGLSFGLLYHKDTP